MDSITRPGGLCLLAATILAIAAPVESVSAALRYAGGHNGIVNPSSEDNYTLGPWRISENVTTSGSTAAPLEAGQRITLRGTGQTVIKKGPIFRVFGAFNIVAQQSQTVASTRPEDVVFSIGGGAASPASIAYCPPINDPNPLNGNLSCDLTSQAGPGTYAAAIRVAKTGNSNGFGGVYKLMRNADSIVWYALSPWVPLGNTTQVQVVSKADFGGIRVWTPGAENFEFFTQMRSKGPRFRALLTNAPDPPGENIQGAIATLLNPGSPTPPLTDPPVTNKGWGFRMTTGVISGSDMLPAPTTFFTSGKDTVTPSGNVRNIVLVGGGIATNQGSSFTIFNNVMRMRFSVTKVPEPGVIAALAAGTAGLLSMARRRRD